MKTNLKAAYPLEKSPLYQMPSKKRLAELLEVDLVELKELHCARDDGYVRRLSPGRNGKKDRWTEDPKPVLKKVQKRLNRLMQRVEHPQYLQAGLQGTSYLKNALAHSASAQVCSIDIKGFYQNCKRDRVFWFFHELLRQPFDVASLLADITTYSGYLPTGGPFSLLLAYWSNKDLFDRLWRRARQRGLVMTVYVDDITFSGNGATEKFLNTAVRPLLKKACFKGHKIKTFPPNSPNWTTGIVNTNGGPKVPFSRSERIRDDYKFLRCEKDPVAKIDILNRLVSRLCEAATVDTTYHEQRKSMLNLRTEHLRQLALTKATRQREKLVRLHIEKTSTF